MFMKLCYTDITPARQSPSKLISASMVFAPPSVLPSVASGDSLPFVGPQPHSVAALKTPVAPGIVGAIGCVIAVLSDAFGCTSAPFAARKDGRMFLLTSYLLLITMQ